MLLHDAVPPVAQLLMPAHSLISVQVPPLPMVYPVLHVHVNDPVPSAHVAVVAAQPPLLVAHSLMLAHVRPVPA